MEKTAQQAFDELVAQYGAEAIITAINNHKQPGVHTDGGTTCKTDSDCSTGYYCNNGSCILKVGP